MSKEEPYAAWKLVSDALKALSAVWLVLGAGAAVWTFRTFRYFASSALTVIVCGEVLAAVVGCALLAFCAFLLDGVYGQAWPV
ncbi:MAG: hypothetical protein JWM55_214 [Acidimicrobiaceae bacterium]|nr:hypothetical protein [Acidimicrobiaceae bacterium]